MEVPQRYREIKDFLEGLRMAGLLESGEQDKLHFISSPEYWTSHLASTRTFKPTYGGRDFVVSDVFSVYYMKNRDEVILKASLFARYNNIFKMFSNNVASKAKELGFKKIKIIDPIHSSNCTGYIKLKLEENQDLKSIYEVYKIIKKYGSETTPIM